MYKVKQVSNNRTDIAIIKGNTFRERIKIRNDERLLYVPAPSDEIVFIVKQKYEDEEPLFTKKINYDDMLLELKASETAAMRPGTYVYSIQIRYHTQEVDDFIYGNLTIKAGGDIDD